MNSKSECKPHLGSRLGTFLSSLRHQAGLTQEEVAHTAEISVRALRNIELGLVARPRRRTIDLLMATLGVNAADSEVMERYLREARRAVTSTQEKPGDQPTAPRTLPMGPSDILGRSEQLSEIGAALSAGGENRIILITGPAGVGKTALAVHAGRERTHLFPGGQIFLDLSSTRCANTAVIRALHLLGVQPDAVPHDSAQIVDLYRELTSRRRILVVADEPSVEEVRALTPGSGSSALIVASRSAYGSLDNAHTVHIPRFSLVDGLSFLESMIGSARVQNELDAARIVVDRCEGLPLALRIVAGRLLVNSYRSLEWMARRLADDHRRLDELSMDDVGVRASLATSCADLTDDARRLLELTGTFTWTHITPWIAAAGLNATYEKAESTLDELAAVHLVDPVLTADDSEQQFSVHGLIRQFAIELGRPARLVQETREARRRMLGCALRLCEEARHFANRTLIARELPRLARWGSFKPDWVTGADADAWVRTENQLLISLIVGACDAGEIDYAYSLAEVLVEFHDSLRLDTDMMRVHSKIMEAASKAGHDVALGYAALGRCELHANRGDMPALRRDLQIAFEALAGHDADLPIVRLSMLLNLAHIYRSEGDFEQCHIAAEEAVRLGEKVGDKRALASVQHTLGVSLASTNRPYEGLALLHRSLDTFRTLGVPVGISLCLMRIGSITGDLGRFDESSGYLEEALDVISSDCNPQAEPFILIALADNAVAAGKAAIAETYIRRCRQHLSGRDAATLEARLHFCQGKVEELRRDYAAAVAAYRRGYACAVIAHASRIEGLISERLHILLACPAEPKA